MGSTGGGVPGLAPAAPNTFSFFGMPAAAPAGAAPAPAAAAAAATAGAGAAPAAGGAGAGAAQLVEGAKAPSLAENLKLADVLDRWTRQVTEQKRGFDEQAKQVYDWDARLRHARVGLAKMTDEVHALRREQADVEAALRHVDEHNARLEAMLGEVERYLDERLGPGQAGPQPDSAAQAAAQQARGEAYAGARRVESLLRTVDERLQAVAGQIAEGLRAQEAQHPLRAATAVLNALVASLTDVEEAARGVERKAAQLRLRVEAQ